MARTESLDSQVSQTLGDSATHYDIPAIVKELKAAGVTDDVDAIGDFRYWEIARKHDLAEHGTGYVAWLTTSTHCLDSEHPEVQVESEDHGGDGGLDPIRLTDLTVGADLINRTVQDAAEVLLTEHGWTVLGDWSDADYGWTATVRRTPQD